MSAHPNPVMSLSARRRRRCTDVNALLLVCVCLSVFVCVCVCLSVSMAYVCVRAQEIGLSSQLDVIMSVVSTLGGCADTPVDDVVAVLEPTHITDLGLLAIPRNKALKALAAAKDRAARGEAVLQRPHATALLYPRDDASTLLARLGFVSVSSAGAGPLATPPLTSSSSSSSSAPSTSTPATTAPATAATTTNAAAGAGGAVSTSASASTSVSVSAGSIPFVPFADLKFVRSLGNGAFGDVYAAIWRGDTKVAVKANGVACADRTAIDNERQLLEVLARFPHTNVVTVYGMCVDAPDGLLRIVMQHCEPGNLTSFLSGFREVRWAVGAVTELSSLASCPFFPCPVLLSRRHFSPLARHPFSPSDPTTSSHPAPLQGV